MMRRMIVVVAMIGCGGGGGKSGVSSDKKLNQLSASEISDFCSYEVDVQMAPRTVDCGNGLSVTLKDKAACIASFAMFSATCAATVEQAESCAEAVGADPCNFGGNTCAPILQCVSE